jgi:tRNA A37 threonylcarbamoyltransferase TsaD
VVLTEEQAVVLVGGFGESEYLRKRLKDTCNAQGIELFSPENA